MVSPKVTPTTHHCQCGPRYTPLPGAAKFPRRCTRCDRLPR